jgi:uncharacterized delta-60 repeat protein
MRHVGSTPSTVALGLALSGCATGGGAALGDAGMQNTDANDAGPTDASLDAAAVGARDGSDASSCSGGMLDPTFGSGGTVLTSNGGNGGSADGVMLQPDGRIVTVGIDESGELLAVRFDSHGGLDPTFGDGGTAAFASVTGLYVYAGALQPDGHILAAGAQRVPVDGGTTFAATIARLNQDGTLDDSFGSGGFVRELFGSTQDTIPTLAVQGDGRILALGWARMQNNTGNTYASQGFIVLRYLPSGERDPSFGNGGKVVTVLGGDDWANGLAIDPDGGDILAAGVSSPPTPADAAAMPFDFGLARYAADGGLQIGFGVNGTVTAPVAGAEYASGVAIQSDGKILTSGRAGKDEFAVTRFTAKGAPDETFGDADLASVPFPGNPGTYVVPYDIALASDGKILVAGIVPAPTGDCCAFGLVRFTPDGKLDPTFGSGGVVVTHLTINDQMQAMTLQPDGKIILAGYAATADYKHSAVALVRYCP